MPCFPQNPLLFVIFTKFSHFFHIFRSYLISLYARISKAEADCRIDKGHRRQNDKQ